MTKLLLVLALAAIVGSLAAALWLMLGRGASGPGGHDRLRSRRMARALALRVGLSVLLFIGLLLAWKLGYIQPTGIAPGA